MITISLDEYGDFENDNNNNKPVFIAGLIFDDLDNTDEEKKERERIKAYYKKVICDVNEESNVNLTYPQALHCDGNASKNSNVGLVKSKVSATLPEFIQQGTYNNMKLNNDNGDAIRGRRGRYHIFVMLKSDDGKKKLLSDKANILADDNFASNRYFHMASSVVNRIIFHNPIYKSNFKPTINLNLATRTTPNLEGLSVNEYKKQGQNVKNNNGNKFCHIMTSDVYRTLIQQEITNNNKENIKIKDFKTLSINYSNSSDMEFLYMSDSICSILSYSIGGTSADEWLTKIDERVKNLNSNNINLIFGYDEIDNDFSYAWKCYECNMLYEALSVVYDAKQKDGRFAKYYVDNWFHYIEDRVFESSTQDTFEKDVNELASLVRTSNLEQKKLLYLSRQYEKIGEKLLSNKNDEKKLSISLYTLYDTLVTAYCHIGDPTKALEYNNESKKYAYYVGIDAVLRTNNKVIVCLEDSFEWNEAEKIACDNVKYQEMVSEMKHEVLKFDKEKGYVDEAKAISQQARIYAVKRDIKAEELFKKAIDILKRNTPDYKITQSYLLHFYADMGMKEAFDKEVLDYFDGKKTYLKRLTMIENMDSSRQALFNKNYALYVLIRGLYYFHQDEIEDTLWNKLCVIDEKFVNNEGKQLTGHPWEIIYKYMEMLAIKRGDNANKTKFMKLKEKCLYSKEKIIKALNLYGEAEVAACAKDIDKRDKVTLELATLLNDEFEVMKKRQFSEDGTKRYDELYDYFSFMYR